MTKLYKDLFNAKLLILFFLSACDKSPPIPTNSFERQEINGVLVLRRNALIKDFSQDDVLKHLSENLKKENLASNINLTFSYSRLTIAGQVASSADLQKIINLAFAEPEISEIISTVIIAGDKSEEAIL